MSISFPGESPEYRAARDRLLEREIDLRRVTEAVAAARRELPRGGPVPEDYAFQGAGSDATPTDIRLSELFYAPWDPGQDPRHVGTLEPVWNLFDLTREGRPASWDEQLSYS